MLDMNLKTYTKSDIEQKADEIRKYSKTFPISVLEIANALGLSVLQFAPKENGVSGMLDRRTNTIYINQNDSPARKRFSVAHEIGHFVLHKKDGAFISYRNNVSSLGYEIEEIEANHFAATLLMPEKDVITTFKDFSCDIDDAARFLNVSRSALANRLEYLGVLND